MSRFDSELAGAADAAPGADAHAGDHHVHRVVDDPAALGRPPVDVETDSSGVRGRAPLGRVGAGLANAAAELGGLFALTLDVAATMARTRFAWRECLIQTWFAVRIATPPAVMLVIPFFVLTNFLLNSLLGEIGAGDLAGAGASLTVVTQAGGWLTAIVIGGAVATAVCADLGARTIREEIDAMKVMGIDPIQRLVVPRVVALTLGAELLSSVVCVLGLASAYGMSVFGQDVTPGAFAGSLTLLVGLRDVIINFIKVAMFGAIGALIGCYKGLTVSGGPDGVGRAVNETVVYSIFILFLVNSLVSAVATIGGPT